MVLWSLEDPTAKTKRPTNKRAKDEREKNTGFVPSVGFWLWWVVVESLNASKLSERGRGNTQDGQFGKVEKKSCGDPK